MALALAISCDTLDCGARVVTVAPFEEVGFGGGLSSGFYGDTGGWIDGSFSLPEGWRVDGDSGRFSCPTHAGVIEADAPALPVGQCTVQRSPWQRCSKPAGHDGPHSLGYVRGRADG